MFSFNIIPSNGIAIDLGTANTLIYMKNKGIVCNEPSVVAINTVNQKPIAYGHDAKKMLERTPANITAIRPMRDGVIANYEVTEQMLKYFINAVRGESPFKSRFKPRVIVCVPSGVTQVEKRAVKDSAYQAGAREVFLLDEAMAAAIGAGLPIQDPSGNMIVDIGGGTTEVAIISLSGIVYSSSVRVGGDELSDSIVNYIKKKYSLLVGTLSAEAVKIAIGSADPHGDGEKGQTSKEVKGRDLLTGIPKTINITMEEISEAMSSAINEIIEVVRIALEKTPPELSSDIMDRGIVLTGGGALLQNLDKVLEDATGLPIIIHEEPLFAVVNGAGKALENAELLKKIAIT